jgi:hypothetical protein
MTALLSWLIRHAGSLILPIVWRLVSSAIGLTLERAMRLAQDIVDELRVDGTLSNAEKRALAAARIKADLLREGVDLRDSLVNLLIELAVQAGKDLAGAVRSVPPPA